MFELLFLSKALSGEEFVPVDLEADSSDSHNNIFVCVCVWIVPALLLRQRKVCDMILWIIYLPNTHPKLSKKYMFAVLLLVVYLLLFFNFKRAKTVCLSTGADRVILWRLE